MNCYQNCPQILQIVSSFDYPDDKKEKLIKNLVAIFRSKQILKSDGKAFFHHRENAVEYLLEIAPKLSEEEIDLLYNSPDEFYAKFIFSETKSFSSLYLIIMEEKGKETLDHICRHWNDMLSVVYDEYGISPFEKYNRKMLKNLVSEFRDI